MSDFYIYLLVMVVVTYAVRAVPLLLFKKKAENRFIQSLLYYVPFAVLSAMTVPAVFGATGDLISSALGFAAALVVAFFTDSIYIVAASSCLCAFVCELIV